MTPDTAANTLSFMADEERNPDASFNPYAAPDVPELALEPGGTQKDLRLLWIGAVLINLPVPVMFGVRLTEGSNTQVGMLIGVAFWCMAGIMMLRKHREFMRRVMVGAVAVALSQFIGILQIFCGSLALNTSKAILEPNHPAEQINGLPTAVSTTILTGLGLIVSSFLIGAVLVAAYDSINVPNRPARK